MALEALRSPGPPCLASSSTRRRSGSPAASAASTMTRPPITTVASGRCTSAPAPRRERHRQEAERGHERGREHRPEARVGAAQHRVGRRSRPPSRRRSIEVTSTRPFSTATPKSAMKPIAAETLSGSPRTASAAMPPEMAIGTLTKMSSAGPNAAERHHEQHEDQRERDRDDDRELLRRATAGARTPLPTRCSSRPAASRRDRARPSPPRRTSRCRDRAR